jgi:hypothetical protein
MLKSLIKYKEYKIMKATKENILHYLQELQSELQKDGITSLALFGSYAKGEETVYSDIDIAFIKDKKNSDTNISSNYFDTVGKIKEKIGKKFHRNIDTFDLNSQSPFKKTIEQELIYV